MNYLYIIHFSIIIYLFIMFSEEHYENFIKFKNILIEFSLNHMKCVIWRDLLSS